MGHDAVYQQSKRGTKKGEIYGSPKLSLWSKTFFDLGYLDLYLPKMQKLKTNLTTPMKLKFFLPTLSLRFDTFCTVPLFHCKCINYQERLSVKSEFFLFNFLKFVEYRPEAHDFFFYGEFEY